MTASVGAGGASEADAGTGASIAGLGDSGDGCDGLSSGGIDRFYSTAGLCWGRLTQRVEPFARMTILECRRRLGR